MPKYEIDYWLAFDQPTIEIKFSREELLRILERFDRIEMWNECELKIVSKVREHLENAK